MLCPATDKRSPCTMFMVLFVLASADTPHKIKGGALICLPKEACEPYARGASSINLSAAGTVALGTRTQVG